MKWFKQECLILGLVNQEKIRVSIVRYTNTLPFKWALKRSAILQKIDLQEDIPSICAQKLKFGQVDLALVPVAVLPELETYQIVSRYCIGAKGKVDTVKLYSRVPIEQIEEVSLDYQSKSSNALTRVLFRQFWKKNIRYREALPGFEQTCGGTHAIVVIGDRTFELNGTFEYEYDLSEEWQRFTGLPFVFACWVSTKTLDDQFIQEFDNCLLHGVANINSAVEAESNLSPVNQQKILDYLTQRIDYPLDEDKKKAMALFLQWMSTS